MSKRDSLVYRSLILASSNVLLQLMAFAFRVVLSRLAGAEGMGVNALAMQAYSVLYALCISGMNVAVTTLSARYYAKSGVAGVRKLVRLATCVFLALLAAFTVPLLSFRDSVAQHLLGDLRTSAALWLIPICIMLTGFENVLKSSYYGMGGVKKAAVSELIEQCIRYCLVIMLLYFANTPDNGEKAFLMVLGMTLSEVFSVTFLGVSFRRKCNSELSHISRDAVSLRKYADIALPSTLTALSATVLSSASTVVFPLRLVVAGFSESDAIAALGIISGMLEPMLALPMAFVAAMSTVLLPSISGCSAAGDMRGVRRKTKKALLVSGALAVAVAAIVAFAPQLSRLLFAQDAPLLLAALLGAKTVVNFFLLVTTSVLNGIYEHKKVLAYSVISEALQLALIWYLTAVPQLNVFGYVAALIVGDALRLTLNGMRVHRMTRDK
ncbi:MAG: MATE family efflux transporter [Clostridia bacterium]|nr:MATE family efflux transporter [Clostridia bacterium]